ncbi:hypothetical protein BC936DRAFT_143317 [Jimgerdemannia flammicorona]|uniref:Major facilitator superfamily domain-containing protein n=1 Tax=Jimgerdemannia flammicorona TaxID=994334 RepID=A0A432ZZ96_9FUNG|nr:hypothetical protein BC936DRAFT_143317 [Jimgerdemannia flammicorona]
MASGGIDCDEFTTNLLFGMAYFAPLYYIDCTYHLIILPRPYPPYILQTLNQLGIPISSAYTVSLGLDATLGSVLTGVCNGVSVVGRIVTGFAGDRRGYLDGYELCGGGRGVRRAVWIWRWQSSLVVFLERFNLHHSIHPTLEHSFHTPAFIAQFTIVAANVFGAERMPTVNSLLVPAFGIGCLVGNPLAGWILDQTVEGRGYAVLIAYTLIVMLVSCTGAAWLRFYLLDFKTPME